MLTFISEDTSNKCQADGFSAVGNTGRHYNGTELFDEDADATLSPSSSGSYGPCAIHSNARPAVGNTYKASAGPVQPQPAALGQDWSELRLAALPSMQPKADYDYIWPDLTQPSGSEGYLWAPPLYHDPETTFTASPRYQQATGLLDHGNKLQHDHASPIFDHYDYIDDAADEPITHDDA